MINESQRHLAIGRNDNGVALFLILNFKFLMMSYLGALR